MEEQKNGITNKSKNEDASMMDDKANTEQHKEVNDEQIDLLKKTIECFRHIDKTTISELVTWKKLEIGEPLIHEADECNILVTGKLRQLIQVETKQSSLTTTLCIHQPGFIAGLASCKAGQLIESHLASSDCLLASIEWESWKALARVNEKVREIESKITVSDIWPLVEKNKDLIEAKGKNELRNWVVQLAKNSVELNSIEEVKSINQNTLNWYVAENCEDQLELKYGSNAAQLISNFSEANKNKYRLIGIPKESCVNEEAQETRGQVNNQIQARQKNTLKSEESVYSKNKIIEKRIGDEKQISDKKDSDNQVSIKEETNHPAEHHYFAKSDQIEDEILACLKCIAKILKVPIREDSIKKVLVDIISKSNGIANIQAIAFVAETMGFQSQLLDLPIEMVARAQVPTLLQFGDGEYAVLVGKQNSSLRISRPRSEICDLSADDLRRLSGNGRSLPTLVLKIGSDTPRDKFGISWFIPAIKKHKRALSEVLIASFLVQIFQLMNPLIIQQLIDKVIGQGGQNTLPVLAILLFSFALFENLISAVRTNLFIDTTNRIDVALGEKIIDHLLRLPLGYFEKRPVGELSTRLAEMEQIRSFLTGTALTAIIDILFSFVYICVMIL